jgi:hypothetical protein
MTPRARQPLPAHAARATHTALGLALAALACWPTVVRAQA